MKIDQEKILMHAESLAVGRRAATREDQISRTKRFLKIETERLKTRHRLGLGGLEVARIRTYMGDLVLSRTCEWAQHRMKLPSHARLNWAAVALGAYGRGELAPFSSLNLLFLHAGREAPLVKRLVELVLHLLWDV
ncbi:MAG: hypothetical protein HY650_04145, partial [Acidobacteria bacterium]|nr:hypothetical protein [Acidobacteriota bacterium]